MERIAVNSSLGKLLEWCKQQAATDLHAQADRRYSFRVDGSLQRIPCLEIMRRNAATQEAIAANDPHLLTGIIEASVNEGMHSFDQHLIQLLTDGSVTLETARYYAVNWNRLDMQMHGYASPASGSLKPDRER